MSSFVAVPAQAIESFLHARNFTRSLQRSELVFYRHSSKNPSVLIKVYTSIRIGQGTVRASGKDAIRVCCVFDNGQKSFGIGKFPPVFRVHSVDSVLTRLKERLIQAANRGNEWISQNETHEGRLVEKTYAALEENAEEDEARSTDPDFTNWSEV